MTADRIESSADGFTLGEQSTKWASTVVVCDWANTEAEQAILREITWQFEYLRNQVGVPLSVHVSKYAKESSAGETTAALIAPGAESPSVSRSLRASGPDAQPTPSIEFYKWWYSQDTAGLSPACQFSAWNAWLHKDAELQAANERIEHYRQKCEILAKAMEDKYD